MCAKFSNLNVFDVDEYLEEEPLREDLPEDLLHMEYLSYILVFNHSEYQASDAIPSGEAYKERELCVHERNFVRHYLSLTKFLQETLLGLYLNNQKNQKIVLDDILLIGKTFFF